MSGPGRDGRPGTDRPDRAAVAAMLAADRASRALGMELSELDAGRAVVRMTVTEQMVNGHGTCHGGLVFALADTAFSCACNSDGRPTVAAAAEVVFVRPARPGDRLVAEAVERVRFGRNGVFDVTVRRSDGAVVAEFRGRSHRPATPPEARDAAGAAP